MGQRPPLDEIAFVKLTDIAMRMVKLASAGQILGRDLPAAVRLGAMANSIYGLTGMLFAFQIMSVAWSHGFVREAEGTFHPSDFNAAWSGVGPWRM